MSNMIECGTCGYPLTPEERTNLIEYNGRMVKPWQSLTDEEAFNAFGLHLWPESFLANVSQELKDTHEEAKKEVLSRVRAIEAKLKEKNK